MCEHSLKRVLSVINICNSILQTAQTFITQKFAVKGELANLSENVEGFAHFTLDCLMQNAKPTLAGAKIKVRKGVAKSGALLSC